MAISKALTVVAALTVLAMETMACPPPDEQSSSLVAQQELQHGNHFRICVSTIDSSLVCGLSCTGNMRITTTISTENIYCAKEPCMTSTMPSLTTSSCGHARYSIDQPGVGIVGGDQTRVNEYPWIARLTITGAGGTGTYLCGATIISENYLLTAAQCVADGPAYVTAHIGDHLFGPTDSSEFGVRSTEYTIHPNYTDFPVPNNDFALLRLEAPLDFTSSWSVQKVCLPTCPHDCSPGTDATIAGWGTLSYNGNLASALQHATVPIQDHTLCGQQHEGITNAMICAGNVEGGTDTCQGDSGGPLMTIENGAYTLCGVTSWGEGCALPNRFGFYANVCSALSWIKSTAGISSGNGGAG